MISLREISSSGGPFRAPARPDRCWLWLGAKDCASSPTAIAIWAGCAPPDTADVVRLLPHRDAEYLFAAHFRTTDRIEPTERDISTCRQLWRTARALGTSLQDNVLIGRSARFSFREQGLI
jgi:hypothetical protein